MSDQPKKSQPQSKYDLDPNQEIVFPELYSKTVILVFALLFSTVFSAVLFMANLRKLGRHRARFYVLIFAILYLFLTAAVIQLTGLPPNYSFIANVIGAAVINEYFWNKYLGRDLPYKPRNWMKPAVISLLIVIPLFFLLMIIQ